MRNDILELINREPFEAFRIVLASGEGFEVSNPNLVAMGETTMHIYLPRSDRYAILRLNQVTSVEVGKENGRRTRKKPH